MADQWQYRIESFRWIPRQAAWEPAPESAANTWFLWGEKGEDHRCFGVFSSRADAERGLDYAKNRDQEPKQPEHDQPRGERYHISQRRNGTEDEIIIHAPDGRHMASIWFWDEEHGEPGVGDKEAKAAGRLIVDALNAYAAGQTKSEATARAGTANAYHASPGRIPYDYGEAIDIRAPDGGTMAFIGLSDNPNDHVQAKADAQLIVAALNAYQLRPAPSNEVSASRAAGLSAALFGGGAAPKESPDVQKESPHQERDGRSR
jgi:hypothetical protein